MFKKLYLIIIFLSSFFVSLHAQTCKFRVNVGVGIPEFTHVGIGYHFADKNLATLNYGFLPGFDSKFSILTLEHFYFLKASKKKVNLKTWYLGQKINLYRQTNHKTDIRVEHILLGIDFGRQFNFSKSFGLKLDFGYALFVAYQQKYIDSNEVISDKSNIPGIPSANLEFFYRL